MNNKGEKGRRRKKEKHIFTGRIVLTVATFKFQHLLWNISLVHLLYTALDCYSLR